jgi:hypothetical protein
MTMISPARYTENEAWMLAKQAAGIDDVRKVTRQTFRDLIALALKIRSGEVNLDHLLS